MPNFNIQETAKHKIITVGHRGVFGGNIPCNTLTSYEIALHQGADMIEIDVDKTADGQLVIFHPGMEWPHLRYQGSIRDLTYAEIKEKIPVHYIIQIKQKVESIDAQTEIIMFTEDLRYDNN